MGAHERAQHDALLYAGAHLLRLVRLIPPELADRPSPVTGASFAERLAAAERALRDAAGGAAPAGDASEQEASEAYDPEAAYDRLAAAWRAACGGESGGSEGPGKAVGAVSEALVTAAEVWPAAAGDRLLGDLLRRWPFPGEELERRRRRVVAERERRLRRIRALR